MSDSLLMWFLRITSGDRKSVGVGRFFGGLSKKYAVQVSIIFFLSFFFFLPSKP